MNDTVEAILPIERDFFLWLHNSHSPFLDSFMWIFTGKIIWIPLVVALAFLIFYKERWQKSLLLFISLILVATLCDQIAASIIKPLFERYRPTHHPDFKEYITVFNNYRGGRYGFISNHACNAFGVSTFLVLLFRYRPLTIAALSWAILNSYTRIYLGVHFLSDILGGMLVGTTIGLLVFVLYQCLRKKIFKLDKQELKQASLSEAKAKIFIFTLLIIVTTIVVISLSNLYLKTQLMI